MTKIHKYAHETFASFKHRNYRLYFAGQGISFCGDWMQSVAMGWLILQLTGSGTLLGLVYTCKYFPLFIAGPFTGWIIDRFDRRKILYCTQSLLGALTFILAYLVFLHLVQSWMLFVFALVIGLVTAIDNPTRQTFTHDIVGKDGLRNAITLNSIEGNLARVVGPLLSGVLIATVGLAPVFFLNAFSYIVVMAMLLCMDKDQLHFEKDPGEEKKVLINTISYIVSRPILARILLTMTVIGTLAYEFAVSIPLLARSVFSGDAVSYAVLLSSMGLGAILCGLLIAGRKDHTLKEFAISVLFFGLSMIIVALMPTFDLATLAMFFVGFFSINLTSTGNTLVQLNSQPNMRGRVMSFWTAGLWGSTFIGAPIIGSVGQFFGARWSLGVGGIAAMVMAFFLILELLKQTSGSRLYKS